jgi:hypothetical protein
MNAYNGEYIKSWSWFTYPIYASLQIILHINSTICSHVQYWWNFNFGSFILNFFYCTFCLFHCIPTIYFSLIDGCNLCFFLKFEVHYMYNKKKLSLWPCYQTNNLIGIFYDFILDTMFHSLVPILWVHVY